MATTAVLVHLLHPYRGGRRMTWCDQRVFNDRGDREPILAYSHDDAQITCAVCIERRQDVWLDAGFLF